MEWNEIKIRFFQGDREAIEHIYRTEFPHCRNFVLRNRGTVEDAKDCFQEAIIALFQGGRIPCLIFQAPIQSYLFGIVRNKWRRYLNRHKSFFELDLNDYEQVLVDQFSIFDKLEFEEMLNAALGLLNEVCKNIIISFYVLGDQLSKIAEDYGYTEQGVKNKKAKCIHKLQENAFLFSTTSLRNDPNNIKTLG